MKKNDLQHATSGELNTKLEEAYQELFNLRFQRTTGKLTNSARFQPGEEGYRQDQDDPAPARAGGAVRRRRCVNDAKRW